MINLNLLVIRAREPKVLADFYTKLGLDFKVEQHGAGPEHFCSAQQGSTFEIYPLSDNAASTQGTRLGFAVDSVEEAVASIENDVQVLTSPSASAWGKRAVVVDPEGHRVELLESRL